MQPHLWVNLADTKLTLGQIRKSEEGNQQEPPSSHRLALTPEHVIGYAYGGHRPHSNHEHVENPNAVVIHTHNGIEVLNLLSGQPITELRLPGDGAVYLDIDSDGEIEQILWGQQDDYSPCYVEIWRINPVKERLEQIPVCRITRLFFTSSWAYDEDNLKKIPPIILKRYFLKCFINHRNCLILILSTQLGMDTIWVKEKLLRYSIDDMKVYDICKTCNKPKFHKLMQRYI